MASLPNTLLTEEEYLAIERAAEFKSEFHDGQMYAMSGGSFNHSVLGARIISLLSSQVRKACRVLNSDMRVRIQSTGLYTYPDCSVVCGEPQFFRDQQDVLVNPILVVEVLSPSTENFDRGKKFASYRTIPSLREYLLVHQDERHVEHFSQQPDGNWLLIDHMGEDATVSIATLSVQLPLSALYASVLDPD
jgi:hypothetical protein